MKEMCSCGPSAVAAAAGTRQAVLDAEERWALRCPGCGRLERALPFEGGVLILATPGPGSAGKGEKTRVPA